MSDVDDMIAARLELQRVSTHILARARFGSEGRFGLRVTPSGIGTPPFGPDSTVLRIAGATLIRESSVTGSPRSETSSLQGRSLLELATFAGVDLATPFSAGSDTPEIGDVEAPIELDGHAASDVMAWHHLGAEALDLVLPSADEPSVAQLWPEHFDLGIDVLTRHGRVNLGASPGDASSPVPYLYVGPWEEDRPGDPAFWNAPFGAVVTPDDGLATPDDAAAFFMTGLRNLSEA